MLEACWRRIARCVGAGIGEDPLGEDRMTKLIWGDGMARYNLFTTYLQPRANAGAFFGVYLVFCIQLYTIYLMFAVSSTPPPDHLPIAARETQLTGSNYIL